MKIITTHRDWLMYKKIISQAPLTLVTLAEVKAQCRVFNTFEDNYLTSLITPYCELAQAYTRRMLTVGEAVVVVENYSPVIQLPFGKVTAISKVVIDGNEITDFTFNSISQKVKIKPRFKEVEITFNAGYTAVPDVVKQAILIAINTAFVNRDDVLVGQTVTKMPTTSFDLLDKVKHYGS